MLTTSSILTNAFGRVLLAVLFAGCFLLVTNLTFQEDQINQELTSKNNSKDYNQKVVGLELALEDANATIYDYQAKLSTCRKDANVASSEKEMKIANFEHSLEDVNATFHDCQAKLSTSQGANMNENTDTMQNIVSTCQTKLDELTHQAQDTASELDVWKEKAAAAAAASPSSAGIQAPILISPTVTALAYFYSNTTIAGAGELFCPKHPHKFNPPPKQLGDFTSSQVFIISDSVLSQVCILGLPGLCCNNRVLCDGVKSFGDPNELDSYYRELNATDYGSDQSDWQNGHIYEYIGRGESNPRVVRLSPDVKVHWEDPWMLIESFWSNSATPPGPNDILIAGMMGNHFHPAELERWDVFSKKLIQGVNHFPGRVVLVSASPQHFAGAGTYIDAKKKECGPPNRDEFAAPKPGGVEMRNAIWNYNVNKHLMHNQTAVVDVFRILSPLWMCHRAVNDCLHWDDGVYSLLAGMILDGLDRLD
jgi:hypothetical protein